MVSETNHQGAGSQTAAAPRFRITLVELLFLGFTIAAAFWMDRVVIWSYGPPDHVASRDRFWLTAFIMHGAFYWVAALGLLYAWRRRAEKGWLVAALCIGWPLAVGVTDFAFAVIGSDFPTWLTIAGGISLLLMLVGATGAAFAASKGYWRPYALVCAVNTLWAAQTWWYLVKWFSIYAHLFPRFYI